MEPTAPPLNPPPKIASFFIETKRDLIVAMNPLFSIVKTEPEPSPIQTLPPPPGFEPRTSVLRPLPPPCSHGESSNLPLLPPPGFEAGTSGRRPVSTVDKGFFFYKLITPLVLQEKKLKIPRCFLHELQESWAELSLANGLYCTVHLIKEDNRIWFGERWDEYLQLLSIRAGIFLLFRYEGNSRFDVSVYNLNALEKLPCIATSRSAGSGHHASCSISGSRCSCPHPSFLGDQPFNGLLDQKPFSSSQNWPSFGNYTHIEGLANIASSSQVPPALPRMEHGAQQFNINTRRWRAVTGEEKKKALRTAQMYDSPNPFFKVTLKPSYAFKGYCLHIPAKFGKAYLRGISETITLVYEGEKWSVKLGCVGVSYRLTNGWNKFATDNSLEEDDVCVFDLIRTPHIVFMVTIIRVLELKKPIPRIPHT